MSSRANDPEWRRRKLAAMKHSGDHLCARCGADLLNAPIFCIGTESICGDIAKQRNAWAISQSQEKKSDTQP